MLVAVGSVKASPGATTVALALAAAWPGQQRRLLLEADPSGGDLSTWLGLPPAPGLASMAAAARHDTGTGLAWRHTQQLTRDLHVVVAPAGAGQAGTCLAVLGAAGTAPLAASPAPVVADCGRLDPSSPALGLAAQAAVTLLVTRPRASDLAHVSLRLPALAERGLTVGLVLAPDKDRMPPGHTYRADEIAATLGVPVHASLPYDPRAVALLASARGDLSGGGGGSRLPLARAAAALAAALEPASAGDLGWLGTPARSPAGSEQR